MSTSSSSELSLIVGACARALEMVEDEQERRAQDVADVDADPRRAAGQDQGVGAGQVPGHEQARAPAQHIDIVGDRGARAALVEHVNCTASFKETRFQTSVHSQENTTVSRQANKCFLFGQRPNRTNSCN